ncbi:MAG TPA: amino acid permease [Chitinophagaceae bacterium]|jgi:basic amino acid/polyamine antiporter, APA family|nr:amino acid permease [Chitinophagaceae bacterium]
MSQLQKTIGLWSATTIVIGSVIGSSIFMKPATMAGQLGSPYLLIIVWIVAGVVSLFGAMAFAELGTMFPETGGQYVYLRKAYGDFIAYLYGWGSIAVINTAAIAAIAFVCAAYAGNFIHLPSFDNATEHSIVLRIPLIGDIVPLENFGVKMLAVAIIVVVTIANYLSVKAGNSIQFVSTLLKAFALIILVFGILFSGKGSTENFFKNSDNFHLRGWSLLAPFMAAVTGAFSSYDGWNNLGMVGGELKNPEKNITKSLLMGLSTCIIIYVLVSIAYLYMLPIDEMASSQLVATDAVKKVMGSAGGSVISILIIVATFGAVCSNLLANARVVFAMSEAKSFFPWAGYVHPKFKTPGNSVLVLGMWSCLFVLSGSFDILADMFVFMSWVFYGLVIAGVFILRKKLPDAERPYRVKGYPVLPAIFILFTGFYLATTVYNDIQNYTRGKVPFINSFLGMLLTAIGIPLYYYFKRKKPGN